MLIIGSQALEYQTGIEMEPKDLDVIGTYDEIISFIDNMEGDLTESIPFSKGKKWKFVKGGRIIEAEIAWPGSIAEELLKLEVFEYASLEALYALKMSHRFLKDSPHFYKTMTDIHILRGLLETDQIADEFKSWFKRREKETYDYGHPKLNVRKGEFFSGDGINYVYDHDSIHEAMKRGYKPAYQFFKPEENDVLCSKEMFTSLPEDVKLNSVIEESYVLAIERSQVPFDYKPDPGFSFVKALEKVCTSITSGWWRDYAWENYHNALREYNRNYMETFFKALERGEIKNASN